MLFNFSNSSANDLVRVLLKNLIKREKTPPELTRVSNGGWFCKFQINSKTKYFKGTVCSATKTVESKDLCNIVL